MLKKSSSSDRRTRIHLAGSVLIIMITLAFFGFYYFQSSSELLLLQSRVSVDDATIASLSHQLSNATNLNKQVSATLAGLNSQLSSIADKASRLKSQFQALNSTLQEQNAILNMSVNNIMAAGVRVTVPPFPNPPPVQSCHPGGPCQGYHDVTEIIDFKANYSGRVIVSGTTNSTSGYIYLEQYNSTSGSTIPIFYGSTSIGSGQDAYFNITPGRIHVYLGNTNVTSAASGILTVVYNY